LKHSKITEEDAAKNPQAVLDVLQFVTDQGKDDSGHFEVRDFAEQQKELDSPLQQPNPKPKPSQSSPTPRRMKTPPIEVQAAKKKTDAVNENPTADDNAQSVRFQNGVLQFDELSMVVSNYNNISILATKKGISINSSYTTTST
jgi:hypothetical protein